MSEHKTHSAIIAEMRFHAQLNAEILPTGGAIVNGFADDMEEAHKRELDELRKQRDLWSRRAAELVEKCNEQYAKLKQVGNAAKLRETLIQVRSAICKFAKHQCDSLSWENSNIQANCGDVLCSWRGLCDAKTAISAALAVPARNCDKGTADEQLERFIKKWESVGYGEIDERSIHMMSIFSRWAQLRYESEVPDESK